MKKLKNLCITILQAIITIVGRSLAVILIFIMCVWACIVTLIFGTARGSKLFAVMYNEMNKKPI